MRPDSRDGKAGIEGQRKRVEKWDDIMENGKCVRGADNSVSEMRRRGWGGGEGGTRYREYAVRGIGRPFPSK